MSIEEKIQELSSTIKGNEELIESAKAENRELEKKLKKLKHLQAQINEELGIEVTDDESVIPA